MTGGSDDRDRLIRLEQSFNDAIPLIRDSLSEFSKKQDSINDLVVELVQQSKRFPGIDKDMHELSEKVVHLGNRLQQQEQKTGQLERDFTKFMDHDFTEFRADFKKFSDDLNKNSWTLGLVRSVVYVLFGGAVTLLVALLQGWIG